MKTMSAAHSHRFWTGALPAAGVGIQAFALASPGPSGPASPPGLIPLALTVSMGLAVWWLWQRPGWLRDVILVTACIGGAAMLVGPGVMVLVCVAACAVLCPGDAGRSWPAHALCALGMLIGMAVAHQALPAMGHPVHHVGDAALWAHHLPAVLGMTLGAGIGALFGRRWVRSRYTVTGIEYTRGTPTELPIGTGEVDAT